MADDGWALVLFRVFPQNIGDNGYDLQPQPYLCPRLVAAIWYMTNQKPEVSAIGLQRLLELGSYQSGRCRRRTRMWQQTLAF